jgi:hypothetical protein
MMPRLDLYVLAGLLALAVALLVTQTLRLAGARTELATAHAQFNAERTTAAQLAASASEANRATEAHHIAHQRETDREADRFAERARTDRAAADRQHDRLLAQARALAAAHREAACHPTDVRQGAPAPGAPDLLADVLGRIDAAAGGLAAFADAAHGAGQACERERDALTTRTQP